MQMLGYGLSSASVRRGFRADPFALSGSSLGYGELKGALLVEKRFDMLQGRVKGESRLRLLMRIEKVLAALPAAGRSTVVPTIAPHVFNGLVLGRATVLGVPLIEKRLVSLSTGSGRSLAALTVAKQFLGVAQGVSTHRVALTTSKLLGADTIGAGLMVGFEVIAKELVGESDGVGVATARPIVSKSFMATAQGVASNVVSLRTEKQLVAAGAGAGDGAAALEVHKRMTAWSSGAAGGAGTVGITKNLRGASTGSSTNDARLLAEKLLGAIQSVGIGAALAQVEIANEFSALAVGDADVSAKSEIANELGATPAGTSGVAGTVLAQKQLKATGAGQSSSSTIRLQVAKAIGSTVVTAGIMIGRERIAKNLAGKPAGTSSAKAELEPPFTYRVSESDDTRASETSDARLVERDVN